MSLRTKIISVALIAALLAGLIWAAGPGHALDTAQEQTSSLFSRSKETLYLWYSDDALTDYLNEIAVAYNSENRNYRIEPEYKDGTDFLQAVNTASVQAESDMPDLYIIADNSLGRAYRAGLAAEVSNSSVFENTLFYPQTAINSVTYQGRRVAYPFYFETAALLYNADYLQSFADKAGKSLEETVPGTIQDIIDFAGNYDAPEGVTSVFSWDVGDIFYNYYFIGESSDLGGECGDDRDKIDIYNADTISALQVFQQLNQYFSLDTDENSYSDILDDFAQGKSVFTVATTDALKTLSEKISSSAGGDETESAASDTEGDASSDASSESSSETSAESSDAGDSGQQDAAGTLQNYGAVPLPDITDTLGTRGIAVTNCLVINGYSEKQEGAEDFAAFLKEDQSSDFFDRTGYLLCRNGVTYSDSHADGFVSAYQSSECESKISGTGNFWILLENTMENVWNGADPNESLKSLDEQLMIQLTGDESYTVEAIDSPEPIMLSNGQDDGN